MTLPNGKSGLISGSPPYMSPEQANGEPIDARSDIFSLGVTLYQLLSGQRPFEGGTAPEIMAKVRTNDRVTLRSRRPDLPEAICHIVEKATAHSPSLRYQSAGDFSRAMKIALQALDRTGNVASEALDETAKAKSSTPLSQGVKLGIAAAVFGVILIAALASYFRSSGSGPTESGVTEPIAASTPASSDIAPPAVAASAATPAPSATTSGAPTSSATASAPVSIKTAEVTLATPKEALQGFFELWSQGDFSGMYDVLSPQRRKAITMDSWKAQLQSEQSTLGLPKGYSITGPVQDNGARSLWTVEVTFSNNNVDPLTKTTWVEQAGAGWRIGNGGLGPMPKNNFGFK